MEKKFARRMSIVQYFHQSYLSLARKTRILNFYLVCSSSPEVSLHKTKLAGKLSDILPKLLIGAFYEPNFGEQVEQIDKILSFTTYYYGKLEDEVALRRIWGMGKASHESLVRLECVSEPDLFPHHHEKKS